MRGEERGVFSDATNERGCASRHPGISPTVRLRGDDDLSRILRAWRARQMMGLMKERF